MLFSTLFVLVAVLFYFIFLIRSIIKKKKPMRIFILSVFLFYLVAVGSIVFFPIPYQPNLLHDLRLDGQTQNNIIPFHDIRFMYLHDSKFDFMKQVGGNVLMFCPFGFLLPLVRLNIKFRKALFMGIISSITIEITQLILDTIINYNYRTSDIDDVICNVIGCVVGYVFFRLINPIINLSGLAEDSSKNKSRVHELSEDLY